MTRSITTSLRINLGAMAFACLSLTIARAVPINQTGDTHFSPRTTPYVNPSDPAGPGDSGDHINGIAGGWSPDGPNGEDWDFGGQNDGYDPSGGWQHDSHNPQKCEGVPDGGSTAMLLGSGVLGLSFMRRYLSLHKRPGAGNAAWDETRLR
jgi:hypothetical protein